MLHSYFSGIKLPAISKHYVELKEHLGKAFFLSISKLSFLDMRSVFKIFIPGGQKAKQNKQTKTKQTNNNAETAIREWNFKIHISC